MWGPVDAEEVTWGIPAPPPAQQRVSIGVKRGLCSLIFHMAHICGRASVFGPDRNKMDEAWISQGNWAVLTLSPFAVPLWHCPLLSGPPGAKLQASRSRVNPGNLSGSPTVMWEHPLTTPEKWALTDPGPSLPFMQCHPDAATHENHLCLPGDVSTLLLPHPPPHCGGKATSRQASPNLGSHSPAGWLFSG